jgi:hypothetical protein
MPTMLVRRILAAVSALAVFLASAAAWADAIGTPECRRDLAAANQAVLAIQAREKRFVPGDLALNCRLLRQNLADLAKARGPMDRCLTGEERGEALARIDAALGDISYALGDKCRK